MKVNIVTQEGKDSGRKATLSKEVYGITPSDHAMYLDVKQYLANQRQGTSKAKERGEISRTTKKLHKQKGTGGARHGSMRSPLFRGGGTIFGPRPRSYSFKLNKKLKMLARRSALSTMAADSHIIVMDKFSMDAPNTQGYSQVISALGLKGKKSMVVLADQDKAVY
ncbi:MAG: 50S ribosomal protein L4, partial [Schleiferiaceae bacterium]|nr:50S ribosomal protein L4 [Schleiferiaceae bacterium]